jgi:hypothetical protein
MTEANLPEMLRILWATRIDATANRWHITRHTIPPLKTLADNTNDDRLHKAVEQMAAAVDHLDAMVETLRTAIDLIQPTKSQSA